jgi:hypothetical protein
MTQRTTIKLAFKAHPHAPDTERCRLLSADMIIKHNVRDTGQSQERLKDFRT